MVNGGLANIPNDHGSSPANAAPADIAVPADPFRRGGSGRSAIDNFVTNAPNRITALLSDGNIQLG
jgi:hypothetical protein